MDKRKKIMIGIITFAIVCVITFIILIIIANHKQDNLEFKIDGITLPKNKEVLEDQIVNNLKISEVSLLIRETISTFKAEVSSNTENNINVKSLSVVFYENEQETKIEVLRDTTITREDTKTINVVSELDLTNITKIEYILE